MILGQPSGPTVKRASEGGGANLAKFPEMIYVYGFFLSSSLFNAQLGEQILGFLNLFSLGYFFSEAGT